LGERAGSALLFVVVLLGGISVLSLSLMVSVSSNNKERKTSQASINSIYVCEAALGESIADISAGGDGNLGGEKNQVAYGEASYWVTAVDQGGGVFALTATGTENSDRTRVEMLVRRQNGSFWQWGAFGDEGLTMDQNASVDSYDSSLGIYEDQDVNGSGANKYASSDGDVGSNGDITLKQNTTVYGDAAAGPTSTTTVDTNSTVTGSTTPSPDLVALPALTFPTPVSSGDWTTSGGESLPAGTHAYDTLEVNGTLTITGPAVVVVTNMTLRSNSLIEVDATGGPVELWVENDFVMNSNSEIRSQDLDPADIEVYLNSDNVLDPNTNVTVATIELNSNTKLYGTIYAPNARIEIDSNFQLYGAIVARHVHMDSYSKVHYDESLANTGGTGSNSFETLCWRVIANP
jgi:predicted acyltransferase (DUF342 family)